MTEPLVHPIGEQLEKLREARLEAMHQAANMFYQRALLYALIHGTDLRTAREAVFEQMHPDDSD